MQELNEKYLEALDEVAQELQGSEVFQSFQEEEEEDLYKQLQDEYEPRIAALHRQVADHDPLQLEAFEKVLLHPAFEGLFLPKILGFSVLRGELNESYHYKRPQTHFKEILMAISQSSNFEFIKKRIGQTVQIGFALSSDIWITDLINQISNKRIRYYLQSQKLEKFRSDAERAQSVRLYRKQFRNENYLSADFPRNMGELKVMYSALKHFLLYRVENKFDNNSLREEIRSFVENKTFQGSHEHIEIMAMYGLFFDLDAAESKSLKSIFNEMRKSAPQFKEHYFSFLHELFITGDLLNAATDARISALLDDSIKDDLTHYYKLMDAIHGKGYIHPDVMDAVKTFYDGYEGLSDINECVRMSILAYIRRLITHLPDSDYHEYFEISKIYTVYINIFGNQQFNQHIKDMSMDYLEKLMKKYQDKRGKDYQDIKKFVATVFVDLGFLKEKEIVEMFKSRRKARK